MLRHFQFLLLLTLSACVQGRAIDTPFMLNITPPATIVYITDESCPSVEVQVGYTIGWINHGDNVHIVQSELLADGTRLYDSGSLENGDGFAITVDKPGTIQYQCSDDGTLTGTINVVPLSGVQ